MQSVVHDRNLTRIISKLWKFIYSVILAGGNDKYPGILKPCFHMDFCTRDGY